jgi:hypothetical protein
MAGSRRKPSEGNKKVVLREEDGRVFLGVEGEEGGFSMSPKFARDLGENLYKMGWKVGQKEEQK